MKIPSFRCDPRSGVTFLDANHIPVVIPIYVRGCRRAETVGSGDWVSATQADACLPGRLALLVLSTHAHEAAVGVALLLLEVVVASVGV
jgi:hypothetical protein